MPVSPSQAAADHSGQEWRRFLLPSAADLIFLASLFSLSCGAIAPRLLNDADIGWHIRNGELILQSHTITRTDPFSSVMGGQRWYAWEWLFDVLVAAAHHAMGLNGVVFIAAIVIAASFALAFRLALRRGGNFVLTILLLALAVGASAIHLFARPHVFGWLMVVAWFEILQSWEEAANPPNRRLLWLPVLMLLWVNLHGGFLTGFLLLAIYFCAEMEKLFHGRQLSRLKMLGGTALLSFAATLINPNFFGLYVHLHQYLSDRFLMDHIEEFRSPDFHGAPQQCFAVLVLISFLALATARVKPRVVEVLIIIFAVASGLYSARNLPVSSLLLLMIVAPLLSRSVSEAKSMSQIHAGQLFSRCESFGAGVAGLESSLRGHLWPAAGVLFGICVALHGGTLGGRQWMDARFLPSRFPVQAVDFLQQKDIREPVFCPDYWGGYLIYRLYPQTKVVVDDRHDLYGEQFFKQYLKTIQVEPEWQVLLDREKVQIILVPTGSALQNILSESPEWEPVYQDKVGMIFQRGKIAG